MSHRPELVRHIRSKMEIAPEVGPRVGDPMVAFGGNRPPILPEVSGYVPARFMRDLGAKSLDSHGLLPGTGLPGKSGGEFTVRHLGESLPADR